MKRLVAGLALAGVVAFNPVTGHAALGDQTLEPGMRHSDVQELQQLLDEKGYFGYSETTTYYGEYTTDAVKKFQKEEGITVNGIAGEETLEALGVEYNGSNIVEVAKKYEGTPYQWGGETPEEGFDCNACLRSVNPAMMYPMHNNKADSIRPKNLAVALPNEILCWCLSTTIIPNAILPTVALLLDDSDKA